MDQHNQYKSLLGFTSDLYLVISDEKQYLMGSPALISGIIHLNVQGQLALLPRGRFRRYLNSEICNSDGRREAPSTPGYTMPQRFFF